MASGGALRLENIETLFAADEAMPSRDDILKALHDLMEDCADRGVELKEISSGFRYQARQELSQWVQRLWEEKPQRYSRALLETLALVAYRQPITRSEIEEVRGVSVSSTIMKTLQEREWVRVVGHRDVPGKPAMYATTKGFLDYFSLQSLDELPTLSEIRDIDNINVELEFDDSKEAEAKPETDVSAEPVEAVEADEPGSASESEISDLSEQGPAATEELTDEVPVAVEEEALMQGLSDEEMKAIDVLNKSFRENLHAPVAEEGNVDEALMSEDSEQELGDSEINELITDNDIDDESSTEEEDQNLEQETKL